MRKASSASSTAALAGKRRDAPHLRRLRLYFAHRDSQYFGVARIGRDQLEEYAARRGMSLQEAERWLRPNLD
jgi:hypothetical protein